MRCPTPLLPHGLSGSLQCRGEEGGEVLGYLECIDSDVDRGDALGRALLTWKGLELGLGLGLGLGLVLGLGLGLELGLGLGLRLGLGLG